MILDYTNMHRIPKPVYWSHVSGETGIAEQCDNTVQHEGHILKAARGHN